MPRRGAARREKRIAKRDAAKEERGDQKYKNPKGAIAKRERKRGARGGDKKLPRDAEAHDEVMRVFCCRPGGHEG